MTNVMKKFDAWFWLSVPLAIAVINLLVIGGEPIYFLWIVGVLSYGIGTYHLFATANAQKKGG